LTTNPPDSVKRFTIKKSIMGAFDSAANQGSVNTSGIIQSNNPSSV